MSHPTSLASTPPLDPAGSAPDVRILLYSHDSWGLGHLRRSITIASALTKAFPSASALLVTGSPCATHFPLSERVDVVKLPSVTKDQAGNYVPRGLTGPLDGFLDLRRRILLETFRAFAPQVVIVDHQVLGLRGEALEMLREARENGARTVLGIRDIVDSPPVVAREWSSRECSWALSDGYDRLCVYGSPTVFDPRREYRVNREIADRIEFTGYIVRPLGAPRQRPKPVSRPRVLVTMGGGEDGVERIHSYLDALALEPPRWDSTIVTGPLMRSDDVRGIKRRARAGKRIKVHRFHNDLRGLVRESNAVVSMAGYNSCAELLQGGKPVVFLPRTFPRREQQIRAERLSGLGLARSLVNPAPATLRGQVEESLQEVVPAGTPPSLEGCGRVCEVVGELLGIPAHIDGEAPVLPTALRSAVR